MVLLPLFETMDYFFLGRSEQLRVRFDVHSRAFFFQLIRWQYLLENREHWEQMSPEEQNIVKLKTDAFALRSASTIPKRAPRLHK